MWEPWLVHLFPVLPGVDLGVGLLVRTLCPCFTCEESAEYSSKEAVSCVPFSGSPHLHPRLQCSVARPVDVKFMAIVCVGVWVAVLISHSLGNNVHFVLVFAADPN